MSIKPVENDLKTDERWLLIERIVSTVPFQKSVRLRELPKPPTRQAADSFREEVFEKAVVVQQEGL